MDQPLGFPVPDWKAPPFPPAQAMNGTYCRLEPLDAAVHGKDLFEANAVDKEGRLWTYLPYGPFDKLESYQSWITNITSQADPQFYAIIDLKAGKAQGVASHMRITPDFGSLEVGHINYSPLLKRSRAATEAMYLMMKKTFELGYRRYEWKCNALNATSRAAAQRLGFSYEGVFRQSNVIKGRNRDTAWYAMIDQEWPELDQAFQQWLDPANFDADGNQKTKLSILTAPVLKMRG
ncbi:MAG: GNAT family N-acetyltransferase [Gammaproteobacteria bacterium]|nr:GNAT family N-acetyltransferase [Gammaproteobacteria bacterium]